MVKKLIYNLLMVLSIAVFISGELIGIFSAMGICAAVYGEDILNTALGKPPDYFHPAFWLFMLSAVPGMLIGSMGGAFFCGFLQALAKWQIGAGEKPNFLLWLKRLV